jgi:tetratricopeptide (TPR) repeat protein
MERLIDTIRIQVLWYAAFRLGAWPDSAETAIRLLRALPRGGRSLVGTAPWVADTLMWPQYLARVLLYRGRAREAYQVYRPLISRPNRNPWAWFANPLRDLALLNAMPSDPAIAEIAESLEPEVLAPRYWPLWSGPPHWLPWWFARRDSAALARVIGQADHAARRTTGRLERVRARYLRTAATGYLALLRGDSVAALRELDVLPDSVCGVWVGCDREKLTLARLLAARGDDRRASNLIDQWLWIAPSPFFVIARLERARIAERLEDRDTAIRWYQFVVDVWRHADPELQSYVAEAREGLQRLGGESRR